MGAPLSEEYLKPSTSEVGKFVKALRENVKAGSGTLDSAAADDFISVCNSQASAALVPDTLQAVLDGAQDKEQRRVLKAILDGCSEYEHAHGCPPPADVLEQAFHSAYSTTSHAARRYALDSATSLHQDNLSLQPNRAVIAILSIMSEAIPYAHYLPADIGSNEARLAIMSHIAGSTYGGYSDGALMDASHSGASFISSQRVHVTTPAVSTGAVTGKLTTVQTTDETCDQSGAAVKLIRGRSIVYANGEIAAREVSTSGSGNSTVSGSITISGTEYQIGGTINTDTGSYALTTSPAMGTSVPVAVEGFIDYERDAANTPRIISAVNTFTLHASPWRAYTELSPDARTQMANELGLDPYSESVMAIQAQFANERHYMALNMARRLAMNNQADYNVEWPDRSSQLIRAQILQDFPAKMSALSQQMAIDTMNHGITHAYVGLTLASWFQTLPRDMFEPSGIAARPAIYRIGRHIASGVDIYYTPRGLTETSTTAQMLCVGKATDVTRNPIILGDAVPPTLIPGSVGIDMNAKTMFYGRNFTSVNPHGPSARGCAMLNFTNMA